MIIWLKERLKKKRWEDDLHCILEVVSDTNADTKDQPKPGYSISNRPVLHSDGQKSAKFNPSVESNWMCAAQRHFSSKGFGFSIDASLSTL